MTGAWRGRTRAIVFDFDGLVLDTEQPAYHSWAEIFAEHGCHLSVSTWATCVGTGEKMLDPIEVLQSQLGFSVDRDALVQRRVRRCTELISAEVVLPGVEAYLAEAKTLGLKVGLASSSSRKWVVGHLSRLGLLRYFDCVRCADDVRNTKPDPELYLDAVGSLQVLPEQAVALEDSPNGVLAAKRAGLTVVAVPNAFTCHLNLDEAHHRLSSLAELPLQGLLALVERGPDPRQPTRRT